jgi:hypothetical protein
VPSDKRANAAGSGSAANRRAVPIGLVIALWLLGAGVVASGYWRVHQYVDRTLVFPIAPPRVILLHQPVWMSDRLAQQIIESVRPAGTHSAFDQQMLVDIAGLLEANPWVSRVNQVRRLYGDSPGDAVEIDCDYRAPIALVPWGDAYWLVDGQGYELPEQYTASQLNRIMLGADGTVSLRVITGVRHGPVEFGAAWPGDDLAAGLATIKVLFGQRYAEQIWAVNVANFKGRHDPHAAEMVLLTRQNTEIRWGQPPGDRDFFVEVPVTQKLERLESAWQQYGRVDAGQPWLDIRFDSPIIPAKAAAATPALAGTQGARHSTGGTAAIP